MLGFARGFSLRVLRSADPARTTLDCLNEPNLVLYISCTLGR
jgi:hypothetical protein